MQASQGRLAAVAPIQDDTRWTSPFPLRFQAQLHYLLLGGLDAFDVAAGILGRRASQQAFSSIRFQAETLALLRWLGEPDDAPTRQARAYRVLFGQLSRWLSMLREDAHGEREALEVLNRVNEWMMDLVRIAKEDGIPTLKEQPGRRHLLARYLEPGGYAHFQLQSELGSHPGAVGNLLFALQPGSQVISFNLAGALVTRAFWTGVSTMLLIGTCEEAARLFAWGTWFTNQVKPLADSVTPLVSEATRRQGEQRQDAGGSST